MKNLPSWLDLINLWLQNNYANKYCVIFCRPFEVKKISKLFPDVNKIIFSESEYAIFEVSSIQEAIKYGTKGHCRYLMWDGSDLMVC